MENKINIPVGNLVSLLPWLRQMNRGKTGYPGGVGVFGLARKLRSDQQGATQPERKSYFKSV